MSKIMNALLRAQEIEDYNHPLDPYKPNTIGTQLELNQHSDIHLMDYIFNDEGRTVSKPLKEER